MNLMITCIKVWWKIDVIFVFLFRNGDIITPNMFLFVVITDCEMSEKLVSVTYLTQPPNHRSVLALYILGVHSLTKSPRFQMPKRRWVIIY